MNGKVYIGQTVLVGSEFQRYYGGGLLIQKAIKKCGKQNFKKEILMECDNQESANKAEIFYIKEYDSMNKDIGYNILIGGKHISGENHPSYGKHLSVEIKKKIGLANKNNKSFLGKKHSVETKIKIKKSLFNKFTPKQRIERAIKSAMSGTPEQRIERASKAWKNFTTEQRSNIARKAWKTRKNKVLV